MTTKNLPLVLGVALPVIFILVIAVVIYVPTLTLKPEHNFIYTIYDGYHSYNKVYENTYEVVDEHIVLRPVLALGDTVPSEVSPMLYLYDVKTNTAHQITLDEAQRYVVDPGPSSPDGYIVVRQNGHRGIFELFGSNSDNRNYAISDGDRKKRLDGLVTDRYYSSEKLRVIGWIK